MSESTTVYESVRRKIFDGGYVPGTPVVDRKLAKELGVSRAPIRESLAVLVGQGLLERSGKGQSVKMRSYTPEDIRQMFRFREIVEGEAAYEAASVATDVEIAGLELLCETLEGFSEDPSHPDRAEIAYKFHRSLGEASHNAWIARSLRSLLIEYRYLFYVYPASANEGEAVSATEKKESRELFQAVIEEHKRIVEALRNRDGERSREYTKVLVARGSDRLIKLALKQGLLSR